MPAPVSMRLAPALTGKSERDTAMLTMEKKPEEKEGTLDGSKVETPRPEPEPHPASEPASAGTTEALGGAGGNHQRKRRKVFRWAAISLGGRPRRHRLLAKRAAARTFHGQN